MDLPRMTIRVGVQQRVVVLDKQHGGIVGKGYTRATGSFLYVEDLVDLSGNVLPPGDYELERTNEPERLIVIPKKVQ